MEISVNEFLGMALDNTYDFSIYDFAKNKHIFESGNNEDMLEEIGDMYAQSWNLNNKRGIELNVNSDDE